MREDRIILVVGTVALALVIAGATFAIRGSRVQPMVPVGELPLATPVVGWDPSTESCIQAGGSVEYERSSECYDEPDVTDACNWGIPCFFPYQGTECYDVRRAFCACETSDMCPTGYSCDHGRCHLTTSLPKPQPVY
jgi:hypothetical protein